MPHVLSQPLPPVLLCCTSFSNQCYWCPYVIFYHNRKVRVPVLQGITFAVGQHWVRRVVIYEFTALLTMCAWCRCRNSCENRWRRRLGPVCSLPAQPSAHGTRETEAWNLYCCADIAQQFVPLPKLRVAVREQWLICFWGHCKFRGKPSGNRCLYYKYMKSFTTLFSLLLTVPQSPSFPEMASSF